MLQKDIEKEDTKQESSHTRKDEFALLLVFALLAVPARVPRHYEPGSATRRITPRCDDQGLSPAFLVQRLSA
jgi:hypothetical protein